MILIGLDSNVLAYLAGVDRTPGDAAKIDVSRALLPSLSKKARLVAPVQALGELYIVLTRAGASREEAQAIVVKFGQKFSPADSGSETLLSALDLAVAHRLQLWDSLIINACAQAGCTVLLTEDMQDGFVWRGVTLLNPFAAGGPIRIAAL